MKPTSRKGGTNKNNNLSSCGFHVTVKIKIIYT